MSDPKLPPGFASLFTGPTPEERLEEAKRREGQANAAIPLLENILREMRDLHPSLGMNPRLVKARNQVAILLEHERLVVEHVRP